MDHVMDIDGEQLNMLTISGRSSSSGSVCGSMLGYSHSPSPTPPENGNILMDSELPGAELRDSQFDGVVVGVCAMNKKSLSGPMKNILSRMSSNTFIRVVIFSDATISNEPVENWPYCDAFIAFYSDKFPLAKAVEYVKVRQPKLVINDLEKQYSLQDRRKVYEILQENGVDVPRHAVLNCSRHSEQKEEEEDSASCSHTSCLLETDDTIEVNGEVFHKPFVEKPVSAEDHNIYIYFPSDYGGGSQRLFRKVKDRASSYHKESRVRKDCCFIYEEFKATDGTDVKVYTVGPDYAHAEARKSPALDGKVERDGLGKEKRYPVILSAKEKQIARTVCTAFKQTVCGFDMLRSNGKSYVCDVNGFSFVKNSQKYYDDCAQILLETIMQSVAPMLFQARQLVEIAPEMPPSVDITHNQLELRCVIGVIRHGDRTPKQKMKMLVTHPDFFQLFRDLGGYRKGHLKIKKPKDLQKVLDITRKLVLTEDDYEIDEKRHKLQQLKSVLEMYGYFSGINRKVQFRLVHKERDGVPFPSPKLLLILKWGGELTHAGQLQAEELGNAFRLMYPGGAGEYASLPGSGFLRLHSTYRHDLKVYASDEGRVQMTAAAFTKGLLDLEGNLASILVHLVKRDENATEMLDTSTDSVEALEKVKQRLHSHMQSTEDFDEDTVNQLAPTRPAALMNAIRSIKNPHAACETVHKHIIGLCDELQRTIKTNPGPLYHDETIDLMVNRWAKLKKDFKLRSGKFDISKIPDIYDCIKYDLLHNQQILQLTNAKPLYHTARDLADIVVPQEYGLTCEEKLDISQRICRYLLRKIRSDLHHTFTDEESDIIHRLDPRYSRGVFSPKRHVRTRLYFTSESHIHSLVNILCCSSLMENSSDPDWRKAYELIRSNPEWNYLTQVVFLMFEDCSKPMDSPDRYVIKVHISSGAMSRELILGSLQGHLLETLLFSKHSTETYRRGGLPKNRSLPTVAYSSLLPSTEEENGSQGRSRSFQTPTFYESDSGSDNETQKRRTVNLASSSESGGRERPHVFVRKSSKSESEMEDEEERKVSLKSTGSRKVSLEGVGTRRGSIEGPSSRKMSLEGVGIRRASIESAGSRKASLVDMSISHTPIFPGPIAALSPVCTVPLEKFDHFLSSLGSEPVQTAQTVAFRRESLHLDESLSENSSST